MEFEVKTITPAMAEALLGTVKINRAVRQNHVLLLVMQMEAGKWHLNGQPIIISNKGNLLDGQHRMLAVALTGKSIEMLVVEGVDEAAFETIDTGNSRTGQDVLSMGNIPYPGVAAAASKFLWVLIREYTDNIKCPPTYINKIYPRFPALNKWINFVGNKADKQLLPGSAMLVALVYLENIADELELAEKFFAGVTTGAGLDKGSPILTLRNRLIVERSNNTRSFGVREVWPAVVQTINALEEGRELTKIKFIKTQGIPEQPKKLKEHMKSLPAFMLMEDLVGYVKPGQAQRAKFNEYVNEVRGH